MPRVTKHKTLEELALHLKKRGMWLERNAAEKLRQTAKVGLRSVVRGTPVDTGKARSNWQVGVNTVPTTIIDAYAPGYHLGLSETGNATAAISEGNAVIKRFKQGVIFVANSVPYLGQLNDEGKSPQNDHFIEKAIKDARAAGANQPSLLVRRYKWRSR